MRYSRHIDYLVASVFYLGTQGYWWARTPKEMAYELSLDEKKLTEVFEGFPGIFRKSTKASKSGQHTYSLQARFAQHDHKGKLDQSISYIPPLDTDKIRLLHDFILKSAEDERAGRRALIGWGIVIFGAFVSAMAVIYSATLKQPSPASAPQIEASQADAKGRSAE